MLLGTRLESLDLAAEGKSLRIKAWPSRVRDSGSSLHFQRKMPSESSEPSPDSSGAEATSVLPKTRPLISQAPATPGISKEDRFLLDQLLHAQPHRQIPPQGRSSQNQVHALGDWRLVDKEVSAQGQQPGHPAANDHASRVQPHQDTENRQLSFSDMSEASSKSRNLTQGPRAGLSPRAEISPATSNWVTSEGDTQEQSPAFQHHMQTATWGAAVSVGAPIQWVEVTSGMEQAVLHALSTAGMPKQTRGMDDVDICSPRSNISWQPLSDLGKDDELFCTSLMSTEQEDLGTLRNRLAQVLPKENLSRPGGLEHVTEERLESLHDIQLSRSQTASLDSGVIWLQPMQPPRSFTATQGTFDDERLIITHGDAFRDDDADGVQTMDFGRCGSCLHNHMFHCC